MKKTIGIAAAKFVRVVSAAALLVGLAACGQKGPLYIPDKGGEVVTRPAGESRQSPETGPQPSTQPQTNTTESEKKNNTTPPPR